MNKDAELVETVTDICSLRQSIKIGSTNSFGTGGIETKLEAAEHSTSYGIPLLLANGAVTDILEKLTAGEARGTLFLADEEKLIQDIRK